MIKQKRCGRKPVYLLAVLAIAVSCVWISARAEASGAPVFGTGTEKPSSGGQETPGAEVTEDSVIPDGVYIGETPVGGMTIREARERLAEQEEHIRQSVLTVSGEGMEWTVPFSELGLSFKDTTDVLYEAAGVGRSGTLIERYKALKKLATDRVVCTWSCSADLQMIEKRLSEFAAEIYQEPLEATITRSDGEFHVTQSQTGISMDVESTMEQVREAMENWTGESVKVTAELKIEEPKYTYEALSTIQDILADYVTGMGGVAEEGRGKNVIRGAELIDGTVLLPGESFSAHAALSPFTAANGYDAATAFNNNGYVDSLGGGVCQLTTTLYNAVMYAELQVDARFNHSMRITYARPGFDSTVNDDGSKDLKFTNNYDFPIYIEARSWFVAPDNGQCYFAIWGTKTPEMAARDVTLYYEVIEQEDAVDVWYEHPELEPGEMIVQQSSYPRMVVDAYKKVTVNGEVVSDEFLHRDYYNRSDGIVWYNPGP